MTVGELLRALQALPPEALAAVVEPIGETIDTSCGQIVDVKYLPEQQAVEIHFTGECQKKAPTKRKCECYICRGIK